MRLFQRLVGAALVGGFFCYPAVAFADRLIQTETVPVPGAPIEYKCAVGLQDSAIANFYLGTDFAFIVEGTQAATAVEFRFDLYNAFGDRIGGTSAQKTGYFSPGVRIMPNIGKVDWFGGQGLTGPWEFKTVNAWPDLDSAKCSIAAIRWADGSVWRAGEAPTENPSRQPDITGQLINAEGTSCGYEWAKRSRFTVANHGWATTGGACASAARREEGEQWFAAASRDRARAYVAYVHAGLDDSAGAQHAMALSDLSGSGIKSGSQLYDLIKSPLLAVDGAARDSALNDAP